MSDQKLKALEEKLAAQEAEFQAFAYAVSHDLASPMRHVEGFTRRVLKRHEDGGLDEDTAHDLGIVMKSVEKCQQDLGALQKYSRLSTKFKLRDRVDFDAILASVLGEYATVIKDKNAQLNVQPLVPCDADHNQIKQLLACLVDNALRYTDKDSPPIVQISGQVEDDFQHIRVSDKGIGISEKYHQKVFVMFRRAVSPNDYEGRGCGLAYVKRIVDLHGGMISLESSEGKGASICVSLPISRGTSA